MSKLQSKTSNAEIRDIQVSNLVAASNIRFESDRKNIDEMKASLLSSGQLQNICAAPNASGEIAVFAGATRLQAAAELVEEGKLPADFTLRTLVFDGVDPDSADAIAIAMTENMVRSEMDYIDECSAMEKLAAAKRTEQEIAAIFGYRPKTVAERLLIAKLIPEAHAMVRNKTRDLAWARALTLADASFQKQVVQDIESNPSAWANGEDIRKFLLQSTIPADHALFDIAEYSGEIVKDMFEGDKLSDIDQFWSLQNKAIEDLQLEVEAEGYKEVLVTREPFQSWKYDECDSPAESLAFIEVMPNGKVQVIRGVVSIESTDDAIKSMDEIGTQSAATDDIASQEVRPTPSICEYAAAHRSAMVQAEMANDFRSAMEYTVLAMLGHRNTSFGAQAYSYPGKSEIHIGRAFQVMNDVSEAVFEEVAVNAPTPERRDVEIVAMVRSMSESDLQTLFTRLVAQRIGQQKHRAPDDAETSLLNTFGKDIDIRSYWTPDATFFGLMAGSDLRRLAARLLPGASATRFASSAKKDLVRALANNFQSARSGTMPDATIAATLNAWVPGVMAFPAEIMTEGDEAEVFDEADADLDDLLFAEA